MPYECEFIVTCDLCGKESRDRGEMRNFFRPFHRPNRWSTDVGYKGKMVVVCDDCNDFANQHAESVKEANKPIYIKARAAYDAVIAESHLAEYMPMPVSALRKATYPKDVKE